MIWCCPIFGLFHTRAYFVSNEIQGSSWSRTIVPTYEIHAETRTCLLFYHDPPVESLWSYPVRSAPFDTYMSSCFLPGYASLICGFDSVMDSSDKNCIIDDWWHEAIWFFWPITRMIPYWSIFLLRLRFVDLHWFAWPSPVTRCTLG